MNVTWPPPIPALSTAADSSRSSPPPKYFTLGHFCGLVETLRDFGKLGGETKNHFCRPSLHRRTRGSYFRLSQRRVQSRSHRPRGRGDAKSRFVENRLFWNLKDRRKSLLTNGEERRGVATRGRRWEILPQTPRPLLGHPQAHPNLLCGGNRDMSFFNNRICQSIPRTLSDAPPPTGGCQGPSGSGI